MGTAQRRVRERRARKKAIQAAAVQVFSDKGFSRTTMEDIAKQAELSVGTIYLYYRSKEELYVSLLFESMKIFTKAIEKIMATGLPPDRQLKKVWEYFYAYHTRYPQSYRVLLFLQQPGLLASVSPKTLQEINARAARNFSLASRIVAAAMAKGIYSSHEPREVVDLLWSLFVGLVYLSETRKNLGLTLSTLKDLHRKVFRWLEEGLRTR
ncbi:MAG: TetR/AcrR family transcriptional regulator [Candidatus Rokubacteria bacterium]|nr:TetR/AcrR family transcriptional regulator [Candidatus Rokubacteria bacterium]